MENLNKIVSVFVIDNQHITLMTTNKQKYQIAISFDQRAAFLSALGFGSIPFIEDALLGADTWAGPVLDLRHLPADAFSENH